MSSALGQGLASSVGAIWMHEKPRLVYLNLEFGSAPKRIKNNCFLYFFGLFPVYLAPSGAKYCEKGLAASKIGEG